MESSDRHGENDGNDFGMVSRRNGWTVIMRNVRYGCQYEGTRWLERG